MSIFLTSVLTAAAAIVATLIAIFVVEVAAAIFVRSRTSELPLQPTERARSAVLVPAHNEGMGVRPTLKDLQGQLLAGDRLIVVADNCTDDTASAARALGADVIERCDPERRGKGYALDFGVRHLAHDPPDVLIVIDADCRVAPGALERLIRSCVRSGRPAQALDLMVAPAGLENRYGWATFAWRVRNWVRPLGLENLGMPCQLMGTGMAFPWQVIASADLASGHLVEDRKLGLELARTGKGALFCPTAVVTSEFPMTPAGADQQRQRWESGHFAIMSTTASLLLSAIRHKNVQLLALALDMVVPPLMFLALSCVAVIAFCAAAALAGLSAVPLAISGGAVLLFVLSLWICWIQFGRDILPASSAASTFSSFTSSKLRLYGALLIGQKFSEWTRAERSRSNPPS